MKIFYTGIGCNKSGLHTEKEFLYIMNKEFTYKNWILPDDFILFTLNEWIEYSGAEICNNT